MAETGLKKKGILAELYGIFFSKSWPMWVGGILLGVGNILLFLVLKPWGASGGIYVWGANLFNSVFGTGFGFKGGPLPPVGMFPYSIICFLLLLGAMGAALMAKQFAFRFPPVGELLKGLIGGVIMGIGAVVGKSCTLGGFFSGMAALSMGAVVFTIGLGIGTWIAVKYLIFEITKFPKVSSGKTASLLGAGKGKGSWQPYVGALVLIWGLVIAFKYTDSSSVRAWYAAIGLFFGFVCQRSRFCLVRALREPFTSGDSKPAVGAIAGILVAMFGFTVIKFMGIRGDMLWVWPHFWLPAIIGGIIFGVGMTISGGCIVGSLWRAGEGHIKLYFALIGAALTMPFATKYIAAPLYAALPASMQTKVFLPNYVGYGASVGIFVLFLLVWYYLVKWNERTGKFSAY
ncbi:MAG: YeeE/YedE family protein [Candidatus Sabulitectum sp.]|nr:YeeE/YedE family protein [Candidatus Sabulitectum sp.]